MTERTVQGFIKELLSHRPGDAMTHLEWLRRPPRRIGRGLPIPISQERQQVYARRLRRRRSSHIAELPRYRQELESMCFAGVCLGTLVDDMLRLVEIRITSIWNWGHKIVADRLIPARVRKKSEILADRKQSDWHRRFMLSATILLLGAPMFRVVIHYVGITDMSKLGIVSTLLVDAFFLRCFAYDLVTRRRIHPAYFVALVLIVLDQVAQVKVVRWTPWINFSFAMQRLVT
jgi:hypothetical protein